MQWTAAVEEEAPIPLIMTSCAKQRMWPRCLARFQFRARNEWVNGGHSRTTIQSFYGAGQEDISRSDPFVLDGDEPPVLDIISNPVPVSGSLEG